MKTETKTEESVDTCWPPMAHIVLRSNMPPKVGDKALCGATLMGINLDKMATTNDCKKCAEIMRDMLQS